MINSEQFLLNIKLTLKKLNQCRLVEFDNSLKLKRRYLNSWPLYYDDINIEVIDYLKSIGIKQRKTPYVEARYIPYEKYKQCKKIDKGNKLILELSYLRSYIEIKRISLQNLDEINISIAYDPLKTKENELPNSTNQTDIIEKLSYKKDIMYSFTYGSFKTKVNAYTGMFIFNNFENLGNKKIEHIHRDILKSYKVKDGDKATRVISNDLKNFKLLVYQTKENINKSIDFASWAKSLRELTMQYECCT